MANPEILAGLALPLLFLKATSKKQVWVPPYTKGDGTYVAGHMAFVHVADDHDDAKVAAGQGSHSQKAAHAKLAKEDWFHQLPTEHKAAVVMTHATDIQNAASASAAVSVFKKAVLAGQPPKAAGWKAFMALPEAKREAFIAEVKAAGKDAHFLAEYAKHQGAPAADAGPVADEGAKAPAVEKPAEPAPENPAPAPAPAPKVVAAAPAPAPAAAPAAAPAGDTGFVLSKISAAFLPDSNTNAKAVNAKLGAISAAVKAGDAHALLAMSYGSNTYGQKAAKLANDALAALGSSHTVSPGQKAGTHAGLAGGAAPAPAPAAAPAAVVPPPVTAADEGAVEKMKAAKKPAAVKNAEAMNPADIAAWFAAPVGKAGLDLSFFDHATKPSVTKFHKWHSAAGKWGVPENAKAAYMSAAVSSLYGVHDKALLKTGQFVSVPEAAKQEVETNPARIQAAAIAHHLGAAAAPAVPPPVTAPAAKPTPGLPASEIPKKPSGVSSASFDKAVSFASAGDMPALQKMLEQLKAKALPVPKTAAAVSALIDQLAVHQAKAGSSADAGPKEGDTKVENGVTYVLQGGRWHKASPDAPAAPAPASAPAHSVTSHVYEHTTDGHDKFWAVAIDGSHLSIAWGKNGTAGQKMVKEFASPEAAHIEMAKLIKEKTGKGYKKAYSEPVDGFAPATQPVPKVVGAAPKAAAPAAPGSIAEQAAPVADSLPESVDSWSKVGPQKGYNPGGTFVDSSGQQWYCKFPAGGEKVVKNELLAAKLYALAGVDVPTVKLVTQNGQVGIASKIITGAKTDKAALLDGKAPGLLSGFAVDAWLANWDTVGNNPSAGFDNIIIGPDGKAYRIDAGGALQYGGAGGKKQAFGNEVIELKTMLDSKKNAHTAAVFGKMGPADIAASVGKVAAVPDEVIKQNVLKFGPGSVADREALAAKLIARKHNMLAQYPAAAKAAAKAEKPPKKPKPDPTKLQVNASQLPKPHDFLNWNNSGKAISDKPYVQQNIKDEQAILDFALKGNLVALKDYKFQPVDKMTGEPSGPPLPMDKHPSAHVREFYDDCVSFLEVLANPPEPLRVVSASDVSTMEQLSELFKPFDYGVSVGSAPANQRLGFWIALGSVADPHKFAPKKMFGKLSSAAKEKAHAVFEKLPKTVRTFIKSVQSSGSNNQPYRDGKATDHQGQDTRQVLSDLYANASAHEEGTTLYKWISMPDSMVNQFLAQPEGLVFQNPGSMCTSQLATATSGFGKHRVVVHYAKGASAIDTFGSGGFKGEAEITTLPGARFMVLSRKMVPDTEHGNPSSQRLELEVVMLPPDPTYVANLTNKA